MDAKHINPFIESFRNVMPQIGFANIEKGNISVKSGDFKSPGVMMVVGIVGDIKGNVVYCMNIENAKKIASTMMMGMPVQNFDEIAQSALSELSNMLTANAGINFSNIDISINISTPTLIYGEGVTAKMTSSKVLCIELIADGIPVEINIAFE
jgi:Predicted inhibitor of MCP methylation, homolog of CheC